MQLEFFLIEIKKMCLTSLERAHLFLLVTGNETTILKVVTGYRLDGKGLSKGVTAFCMKVHI